MRYVFDLDGTLCNTEGMDYEGAQPIPERIAIVNQLFEMGAHVTIDTARNMQWAQFTMEQLEGWDLRFHTLRVGEKVAGDVYVDDRAFTADAWFGLASRNPDTIARNLLANWRSMFGDDGVVLVSTNREPTQEEVDALEAATAPLVGQGAPRVVCVGTPDGAQFQTPQRSWPLASPDEMHPDPASVAEQFWDVHTSEVITKVGAWRWNLVQKHKGVILPLVQGKRVIDFGGMAGSIGYGCIVVDHGAEHRAIYDVPGTVDTVFTSHTLEHVADLDMVLDCIRHKLTAGGHVIVHVPSYHCEQLRAENWPHHFHNFALNADGVHPALAFPIEAMLETWADVVLTDSDGHSLIVIARKPW